MPVTEATAAAAAALTGHDTHLALPLYAHLLHADLLHTPRTLPSLLKSIALSPATPGVTRLTLAVHAHVVKLALVGFHLVNNVLIHVHAGLLGRLADGHSTPADIDASTFNTLITAYAGDRREALGMSAQMQAEGVCPDDMVLVACAQLGALEQGKWVHVTLRQMA
ncbi:pentatricopeptide repeat-containing protein At5g66520-like [Phragmites australis]|uniref:pentatricopeptide repeat-containing protein At5g66520-like n=1 Tax=Phragmites australis TaxID=29695 RepID=UPI002D765AB8|nr:pentatricopeptide repeat-containing protein At5g66520-like [Phragmites australis]